MNHRASASFIEKVTKGVLVKLVLFRRKGKADSVRDLFSPALERSEAAFMYLGYSGVVLRMMGGTVAFDVADLLKGEEIRALESLDLLLFTHSHGDHYKSRETLEIFRATGAQIVAEPLVARDLRGKVPSDKLTAAEPGRTYDIGDFKITAVRGVHRGPINLYHVKMGELSVFHGGDSGYVSVSEYPADLVFLPTGRPSPTASPEDALRMALDLKPKVAVAIHGSASQNSAFEKAVREKVPETTVVIPEPYKPKKVAL